MGSRAETALFAYGSLVDPASAAATLGRNVGKPLPVSLDGWRRRFSQARDNQRCEKTFARSDDGSIPRFVLGLNLEPTTTALEPGPNGVLIAAREEDLVRLDVREIRYRRTDVSDQLTYPAGATRFDRVLAYVARPENLAVEPPADAVILRRYADTVERAFATLGPSQLDRYRRTTLPYPVETVEGKLVADRIPEGNPRDW